MVFLPKRELGQSRGIALTQPADSSPTSSASCHGQLAARVTHGTMRNSIVQVTDAVGIVRRKFSCEKNVAPTNRYVDGANIGPEKRACVYENRVSSQSETGPRANEALAPDCSSGLFLMNFGVFSS